MYVICSEVRFVEISSPNECDKILKIPNEQTEPTDYMANCSTDGKMNMRTKMMKEEMAGARCKEREKKTWKECVDEDMKVLGLHPEWVVFRNMWRDFIWANV